MARKGGAPENLIPINKRSPEERAAIRAKSSNTIREKKRRVETAKDLLLNYLTGDVDIKVNGEARQMKRQDYLYRIIDHILAKENGSSVQLIKIIVDAMNQNPVILNNINLVDNKVGPIKDVKAEYEKLMGHKVKFCEPVEEPLPVEVEVKDAD